MGWCPATGSSFTAVPALSANVAKADASPLEENVTVFAPLVPEIESVENVAIPAIVEAVAPASTVASGPTAIPTSRPSSATGLPWASCSSMTGAAGVGSPDRSTAGADRTTSLAAGPATALA